MAGPLQARPILIQAQITLISLPSKAASVLASEAGQAGRVAEVPPKFARVGGSRPDFGPEKAKKHKKHS
jgi:hypothetical protein